jgi:hypothetical protein
MKYLLALIVILSPLTMWAKPKLVHVKVTVYASQEAPRVVGQTPEQRNAVGTTPGTAGDSTTNGVP